MIQLVTSTLVLGLVSSVALAESAATPTKHPFLFRTELAARHQCPDDKIVWANTTSHTLHQRGDHHFAHTRGGFVCESEAKAHGYRGPMTHA